MKVEKRNGVTILITEERLDAIDGQKLKEVVKELVTPIASNRFDGQDQLVIYCDFCRSL